MREAVINFIAFQTGWFACVLGAAHGYPLAGAMVALAAIALHLLLARRPRVELALVAAAVGLGLVFDSFLVLTGWVVYPSGMWLEGLAPYWILAIWGVFATTLNVSMGWLRSRLTLSAVLGAVFGPLSYQAGARLGGIELVAETPAMAALALGWGVFMPLLLVLARRLDGVSREPRRNRWNAPAAERRA